MIGTPRAEMHRAGAIRSRSRVHAAYTLGVPVRLYVHLTWTTLQRQPLINHGVADFLRRFLPREAKRHGARLLASGIVADHVQDRESTRLNSSHQIISYPVFCSKKKQ